MKKDKKSLLLMVFFGIMVANNVSAGQEPYSDIDDSEKPVNDAMFGRQEQDEIVIMHDGLMKMHTVLEKVYVGMGLLQEQYIESGDESLQNRIVQLNVQFEALKKIYEQRLLGYNERVAEYNKQFTVVEEQV